MRTFREVYYRRLEHKLLLRIVNIIVGWSATLHNMYNNVHNNICVHNIIIIFIMCGHYNIVKGGPAFYR